MASSCADQVNLDLCLAQATNPLDMDENEEAIDSLIQLMKDNRETIGFVLRFLGHKIQSPQELEAIKALKVLKTLVQRSDRKFAEELGKFRFLNELIKVISPKYLAQRSPDNVKKKIIELLYLWSVELKHEPKIFEAYQMLKKQGIITQDPVHVLPNIKPISPPPPRPKNEVWDNEENMVMLKRLIHSGDPEDRVTANKLIKMLAHQADRKSAAKSRCNTELELARNNARLFAEVLANFQSNDSGYTEKDLLDELYNSCKQLRPKLFKLAGEMDEKDPLLNDILAVNDELTKVINEYEVKVQVVPQKENMVLNLPEPESNNLLDMSSPTTITTITGAVTAAVGDVTLLSDHLSTQDIPKTVNNNNTSNSHNHSLIEMFNDNSQSTQQNDYLKDLLIPTASNSDDKPSTTGAAIRSPKKNTSCLNELENLMRQTLNVGPKIGPSGDSNMPLNALRNMDKGVNDNSFLNEQRAPKTDINSLLEEFAPKSTLESCQPLPPSLTDIFVPLESVEPSQRAPVILVEEKEIKSVLNFGGNVPRDDVIVGVLTTTNNSNKSISKIFFHISPPKSIRVKLQAPSATFLPPSSPFLPPSAITQVVLIAKSPATSASNLTEEKLTYRLDYSIDSENFTRSGAFSLSN